MLQEMARTMGGPSVRGCYESRVPATLRALAQLGCAARVVDRGITTPPRGGWPLTSLAYHPAAAPAYLAGAGSAGSLGLLRYVGVAAALPRARAIGGAPSRGVVLVLLPAAKKAVAIVVLADGTAERELYTVVAEEIWEGVVGEVQEGGAPMLQDAGDYTLKARHVLVQMHTTTADDLV